MLAADVDDDLLGLIVQAVFLLQLLGDSFPQLNDARRGGIFGLARLQRLNRGFFDIIGRIEIRRPGSETDDINTLGF